MSDDVKAKAREQHDLLRKSDIHNFLNGLLKLCMNEGLGEEFLGEEFTPAVWDAAHKALVAVSDLRHALFLVKIHEEVTA